MNSWTMEIFMLILNAYISEIDGDVSCDRLVFGLVCILSQ